MAMYGRNLAARRDQEELGRLATGAADASRTQPVAGRQGGAGMASTGRRLAETDGTVGAARRAAPPVPARRAAAPAGGNPMALEAVDQQRADPRTKAWARQLLDGPAARANPGASPALQQALFTGQNPYTMAMNQAYAGGGAQGWDSPAGGAPLGQSPGLARDQAMRDRAYEMAQRRLAIAGGRQELGQARVGFMGDQADRRLDRFLALDQAGYTPESAGQLGGLQRFGGLEVRPDVRQGRRIGVQQGRAEVEAARIGNATAEDARIRARLDAQQGRAAAEDARIRARLDAQQGRAAAEDARFQQWDQAGFDTGTLGGVPGMEPYAGVQMRPDVGDGRQLDVAAQREALDQAQRGEPLEYYEAGMTPESAGAYTGQEGFGQAEWRQDPQQTIDARRAQAEIAKIEAETGKLRAEGQAALPEYTTVSGGKVSFTPAGAAILAGGRQYGLIPEIEQLPDELPADYADRVDAAEDQFIQEATWVASQMPGATPQQVLEAMQQMMAGGMTGEGAGRTPGGPGGESLGRRLRAGARQGMQVGGMLGGLQAAPYAMIGAGRAFYNWMTDGGAPDGGQGGPGGQVAPQRTLRQPGMTGGGAGRTAGGDTGGDWDAALAWANANPNDPRAARILAAAAGR